MALKQCRECRNMISAKARTCPHCGAPNKRRGYGGPIVVLAAIGGIAFCTLRPIDPAEEARAESARMPTTACLIARDFVTRRLRAPSTAQFSACYGDDLRVVAVDGSRTRFRVSGYVDAQNGFSAMIRSSYVAVVEKMVGAKDEWRLIELQM